MNETIHNLFHELAYETFPLENERTVRALLHIFCLGSGLDARTEVHSAKGRSDLEIYLEDTTVVFEIKYASASREIPERLNEAKEQIISRDYGRRVPNRELLRIPFVYCEETRDVTLGEAV